MREILKSNDAVLLSFAETLLRDAGLMVVVADANMSVLEGSIDILPRRILVAEESWREARRILIDAGLGDRMVADDHLLQSTGGPLTDDAFLGGLLHVLQPAQGHRAGIDAVLLAAAAPVRASRRERVLDAGAGAGVVGLCVAARIPDVRVTLIEIDTRLAEIAAENVRRNDLETRVAVAAADLTDKSETLQKLGLAPESFDHVLANPPFAVEGRGRPAAAGMKARALAMPPGSLDGWGRFLARMAGPHASATVIHRADALYELLTALEGRFGALRILPIHPRAGVPAIRILVQGRKGSRAPAEILPGLVLHGEGNAFLPQVQALLRDGTALDLGLVRRRAMD